MGAELPRPKGVITVAAPLLTSSSLKGKATKKKTTFAQRKMYRLTAHNKAKARYAELLRLLGDRCAICKKKPPRVQLTLDHVKGKTYRAKDVAFYSRVKRYWAEYTAGVQMRALCISCNARDGRHRQMEGRVHEEGAWTPKRRFDG